MKKFFKSIAVAFSMYSKIPMPKFNWASDDMKYHLCFFPFVGVIIFCIEFIWFLFCEKFLVGRLLFLCLAIGIPFLVTGGFHMDGFMDTMDALHSYGNREKKLEIMKDPHVGGFAIISTVVFLLLCLGFGSEIKSQTGVLCVGFSFVLSRCLSGLSVTYFPKAKKDGMVVTESSNQNKKVVGTVLIIETIIVCFLEIYFSIHISFCGAASLIGIGLTFLYYYLMSKKQFGGINGDLAGFFVCVSELVSVICISVCFLIENNFVFVL